MNCPTCGTDCDYMPIAKQMRAARIAAGLSQMALAEKLGVAFSTIKRWEYGWATPQPESARIIGIWLKGR